MPDCGCIYIDDYEVAKCGTQKTQKARKEHKCTECGRTIQPGEEYEYYWGVWDYGPETYKTCMDCLSIRESFFCKGYIFSNLYQDLIEHIYYEGGQITSECLTPLTKTAREQVCEIIERVWEEDEDI